MTTPIQDLRYGIRILAKNPGFTAVAVLTLALGIGATSAIFSVVYGVLLRPLPYPKPDQIVDLREVSAQGHHMDFDDPNFEDIRAQNHSLQGMAQYASGTESVAIGPEATRVTVATVSQDFFSVMGIEPVVGRLFAPEEQRMGSATTALISYGFWKQNLAGAADLSTIKIKTNNSIFTVIGVLPPGFHYPEDSDIWLPRGRYERYPSRTAHNWSVVGRVRDGVSLAQARSDLSGIARALKQKYGQDTDTIDLAASPLQAAMTRDVRTTLLILLGAVGFLLLVACANVVNLLLAQAAARERELAIRAALGAGRKRLVRQFLTETFLLSLAGGGLGIIAAIWGVDALVAFAPANLPRLQEVSVNVPVLLFALGISVAVAAGLGTFTALRATKEDLRDALVDRGQGGTGTVRGHRLGRLIVGGQLATTLVLLVGAGLLGRSLLSALSVDPGFRIDHIVTMDLSLPFPKGDEGHVRRIQFLGSLVTKLGALPGIEEVGLTNVLPLETQLANGDFLKMSPNEKVPAMEEFEKLFHDSARVGHADFSVTTAGYFKALGIPLIAGRLFDERDTADSPHAALVSESLVKENWPNQNPLGHTIEFGNMDGDVRFLTVVGVVADIHERSLESKPRPTIYVDAMQRPQAASNLTVVMRTPVSSESILPAAREIVRSLDPDAPPRFSTFSQIFSASLKTRRFNLTLVGVFAVSALLLAVAGVYGVMAYSVARRTREFGVRIALGATARSVLGLVLGQAMVTALAGVVVGVAGSLALTRTMQSLLFGVSPTDPLTFAGVALLLTVVALFASYVPAWRATKVDPMEALRYE